MEAAGFALGLAALPTIVDGCLNLYTNYCDIKEYDEALRYHAVDFQIQRARFSCIVRALQHQHTHLGHEAERNQSGGDAQQSGVQNEPRLPPSFTQSYLDVTNRCLRQSSNHLSKHDGRQGNASSLKWTTADKMRLEEMLRRLTHLNSEIMNILPAADVEKVKHEVWTSLLRGTAVSASTQDELNDMLGPERTLRLYHFEGIEDGSQGSTSDSEFLDPGKYQLRAMERPSSIENVEPMDVTAESGAILRAMVEWRPAFSTSESVSDSRSRMNSLVNILRAMARAQYASVAGGSAGLDPLHLGVFRCLGWTSPNRSEFDKLGVVYQLPDGADLTSALTLHELISKSQVGPRDPLSLGERFQLAKHVASVVANLDLIECRHKNISSKALVLFSGDTAPLLPYLINFSDARSPLAGHMSNRASSYLLHDDEADLYCPYIAESLVRGPSQNLGAQRYLQQFDIYSLGVVLLEIGLWRTASQIHRQRSRAVADGPSNARVSLGMREFHLRVLTAETKKLGFRCGRIYESVVARCLAYGGDMRISVSNVSSSGGSEFANTGGTHPGPASEERNRNFRNTSATHDSSAFLGGIRSELARCSA